MKITKYKGNFFDTFFVTFDKAKLQSEQLNSIVEFEFNGINCRVTKDTNSAYMLRDYQNAHLMGWKIVGPDCAEKYSDEIQSEYEKKRSIQDEQNRIREEEYRAREKYEKESFNKSVEGISLELSDPDGWDKAREVNSDGYGGAALDYAEGWAKLMQAQIAKGKTVSQCAEETQSGLGFLGITGFQYGCAVSILSQVWKHGSELRIWYNKKYGVAEDEKGTVNPAILTIGT